jgi:hypothetical protein
VSGHRGAQTNGTTRTAKSCGPDASVVGVKSRGGLASPTGRTKPYSRGDGVKQARSPGRARYKPLKPLRREGRSVSAEPVCSCACFCTVLHTRPRVQRAPGFPCALFGAEGFVTTRATRAAGSRRCVLTVLNRIGCLKREDDVCEALRRQRAPIGAPPPQLSSSAKADDPVFRGSRD